MSSPNTGLELDGREMPPKPNVSMEKSEETVQIRRQMHRAISKRDLDRVQKCLDEAKYLRQWLNPENGESALCNAVRQDAFEICGLLGSYNCTYSEENKQEELDELRGVGAVRELELRYQLFRFARKFPHSSYLLTRSFSIGSRGEPKLPELYETLDKIPHVKTILQVVASSPYIEIMFDFSNEDLECTHWYEENRGTWGRTLFERHEIHIGAKREENELLGTLAHELCHYALQLVYENRVKPYKRSDKSTRTHYGDIVKEIQNKKDSLHGVIQRAFINNAVREEELIVRVPHLLAMHSEQVLQEQVPRLLRFFNDNVIRDMNEFLKKSVVQKDREAIKEQNTRLGKTERTEKLGITFTTKYDLGDKPLLVLTAPNITFLEVMINDAVRSKGESYVFLDTMQWDTELSYALLDNKCYNVILSSDPEFEVEGYNYIAMLEILDQLSRVRGTKVIILTKDRDKDDFVKDMIKREYFVDNFEYADVSNAEFDNVTRECKEKVLRSSRIRFQRKRNVRVSEADVEMFCKALDEDTFLQLCREKEIRLTHEQPWQNVSDASCYVERKCARVTQVDLKVALRDGRNEAFAIVGSSRKKVRELVPSNTDVFHYSEVKKFMKCVLLDSVGQYDALKESPFYKDKTIHLIEYKGENMVKERREKNRTDMDSVHAKPTRSAYPCSDKGESSGYHWMRSNGPVSHLPMVDGGARQILNEKSLRGITDEKVVVIFGPSGMGKSLLSSRLAQDVKIDETDWVLHVDLMEKRKSLNLSISLDAIEQLAKLCDLKVGTFKFSLLENSVRNAKPCKLVVIFGGFDLVDVKCRQVVMTLALALSTTQISKLFLFSRTVCKSEIQDAFHTIAFELIGFDEQQQLEFLRKYWKRNNREMDDAKLDSFARRTLSRFRAWGKYSITENPLLIKMIAEIEEEQLNHLGHRELDDETAVVAAKCSFLDVYEKFVANKFRTYLKKQFRCIDTNERSIAVQHDVKVLEHHFYESYGLLALKAILHHNLIVKLLKKSTLHKLEKSRGVMEDVQEGRLKHGFLDERSGETPVFLHKTFAEFFAAHFLAHKVSSADGTDDVVYDVVAHMYGSEEYCGVLDFFDAMGTKSHVLHRYIMDNDSEGVKNAIKDWHGLDGFGRTPLHVAALHADEETLRIISSELEDKMTEELQVEDVLGMTPLMYIDMTRAWKRLDVLCTRCSDENMKWVKQLRAVNKIITKERRFKRSVFSEAVIMESRELLHYFIEACSNRRSIDEYFVRVFQDRGHGDRKALAKIHVHEMPRNVIEVPLPCSDIRTVSKDGLLLFRMSAALGLVDICTYLLCRLPIDERSKNGESPLHVGAIYGNPNVVQVLLPHSTTKVVTEKNESTPLHAISEFHGLFELRTLYFRALDRAHDKRWWTSSHEIALKGHDVVLSLILPHGDATIRNRSGETALHESARNLFWRSIVLLLPYSDVDSVNRNSETPMLRSVSDNSLLRNLRTTSLLKEGVEGRKEDASQSIASVKLLILQSDVTVSAKEDRVALHQNVSAGHQDVMRLLLPLSSVSTVDKRGKYSLHYAADCGNVDCFKRLLPLSSVNAQDVNGRTALHVSASRGHIDITRLLLLFASTGFGDKEKYIPLHSCTVNGHSDVVGYLLPHSSTASTNRQGRTSLHLSAYKGHLDVAPVILPHCGPLIRDNTGDTALHLGAYYRHCKMIRLVFPYSEADTRNNFGSTALVYSLKGYIKWCNEQGESDKDSSERTDMLVREDIEMFKLLSLHSDVNIPDNDGCTALHFSTSIGQLDITKSLLPLSSVNTVNKRGKSSLHCAAESGNVDVLMFLTPVSAVNARDVDGETALHVSAYHGNIDTTTVLLPLVSISLRDKYDGDPLRACTLKGHTHIARLLIPHSSTTKTRRAGCNPLHACAEFGHVDIVRLILPHTDALIRDYDGDTALHGGVHGGAHGRCSVGVKLLLPYSDVEMTNNSGRTALLEYLSECMKIWKTQQGSTVDSSEKSLVPQADDIRMIKILLLHSTVDMTTEDDRTTLQLSSSHMPSDSVHALLPSNREGSSGEIFLHYVVLRGKLDVSRFLLPYSPLHAHGHDGELLKELRTFFVAVHALRSVGHLTWTSDACKYVLLHYCVTKGNARMTELALPHSSTSGNNGSGCTALQLSANTGREQIVRVILPHSDVMFRDCDGETALHMGAYRHCCDVVTVLLPYSDVNVSDELGNAAVVRSRRGCSLWFEHGAKNTTEAWEKNKMIGKEGMGEPSVRMMKLLVLHSDLDIVDEHDRTGPPMCVSLGLLDVKKPLLPDFDSPLPSLQPRVDEFYNIPCCIKLFLCILCYCCALRIFVGRD